tara:strand:- start:7789 stop:8817 length:1029 start_codon:yes stop_codon:yes gene_type:complete
MRNVLHIIAIVLSCTIFTNFTHADDGMKMPSSMDEFVNWHLDRGACGTWVETGVTKEMWVGIPAGLTYTGTNTMRYEPGTGQLVHSYHMVTNDGRVISTGCGMMGWDAKSGAPVASFSGYDMGKPYHGNSVLKGMTDDTIHWEYTEESQGKTTTYIQSVTYTGMNTRSNSVQQGADGTPWVSQAVRANPVGDLMKATKLAGTWDMPLPDGRTLRTTISWLADQRVLKQESFYTDDAGQSMDLYLMYWDPVNDHIATIYLDNHGTVIHGKVDSITDEGGKVTIVSSHEGSRFGGLTMSTQMTRVVTDKTLTSSFQGMALDGIRHGLSWSEEPSVSTRVETATD